MHFISSHWRIAALPAIALFASFDGSATQHTAPDPVQLRGTVVDAHGGMIGRARVKVTHGTGSAAASVETTSDAQGRFQLTTTRGPQRLYAEAPGYAQTSRLYTAPAYDAELRLQRAGTLRGKVNDASTGQPRAGVQVRALVKGRPARVEPVTSDADGTFALAGLPAGSYQLVAESEHASGMSAAELVLEPGARLDDLQIALKPAARVRVRVAIDDGKQPCSQGSALLAPAADGGALFTRGARIGRDGLAELPGVAAGTYKLSVHCRGHIDPAGPAQLTVARDDLELSVKVTPGLSLKGRVIDGAGAPVPYAEAMLTQIDPARPDHHTIMPLRADAQGGLSLDGTLAPGRYTLEAGAFVSSKPVEFELSHVRPLTELTLRLDGSAYIDVDARDQHDQPVSALQVVAFAPGKKSFVAWEQGGGRYRIGPLTPDRYRVRSSRTAAAAIELSAGETVLVPIHWQR